MLGAWACVNSLQLQHLPAATQLAGGKLALPPLDLTSPACAACLAAGGGSAGGRAAAAGPRRQRRGAADRGAAGEVGEREVQFGEKFGEISVTRCRRMALGVCGWGSHVHAGAAVHPVLICCLWSACGVQGALYTAAVFSCCPGHLQSTSVFQVCLLRV